MTTAATAAAAPAAAPTAVAATVAAPTAAAPVAAAATAVAPTAARATPRAAVRVRIPGWVLLVVAWLAVYAWRPQTLGFYDDDWQIIVRAAQETAPFSWDRLLYQMEIYGNRPGTGLATFLLSSVCGASPVAWHTAAAAGMLGVAFALRAMLRALLRLATPDRLWAADAGAALWLVFPWMLGFTAWPTMAPCIASPIGMALAGRALFAEWADGRRRAGQAGVWFLLSVLTYEAFAFQFIPLLLIGWRLGATRRTRAALPRKDARAFRPEKNARAFWRAAGLLVGAQVLGLAWNRVAPLLVHVASPKPLKLAEFAAQVRYLPQRALQLLHGESASLPTVALALAAGVLCLAAAAGVVWRLRKDPGVRRIAGLLAVCGGGIAIGCAVLGLGGYGLQWVGQGSRNTLCFSFWLATALALALGTDLRGAWRGQPGIPWMQAGLPRVQPGMPCMLAGMRRMQTGVPCMLAGMPRVQAGMPRVQGGMRVACGVLGVVMIVATHAQLGAWAEVWRFQQRLIATAPVRDLASAAPGAAVFLTGSHACRGVTILSWSWGLEGLVHCNFPELAGKRLHFLRAHDNWQTTWDGREIVQTRTLDGRMMERVAASEVWVWTPGEATARRMAGPGEFASCGRR